MFDHTSQLALHTYKTRNATVTVYLVVILHCNTIIFYEYITDTFFSIKTLLLLILDVVLFFQRVMVQLTALVPWPLWRGGKKNASTGGARRVLTNGGKTLQIEAKYSANRGLSAWPLFLSLCQRSIIDKFASTLAKFSSQ